MEQRPRHVSGRPEATATTTGSLTNGARLGLEHGRVPVLVRSWYRAAGSHGNNDGKPHKRREAGVGAWASPGARPKLVPGGWKPRQQRREASQTARGWGWSMGESWCSTEALAPGGWKPRQRRREASQTARGWVMVHGGRALAGVDRWGTTKSARRTEVRRAGRLPCPARQRRKKLRARSRRWSHPSRTRSPMSWSYPPRAP